MNLYNSLCIGKMCCTICNSLTNRHEKTECRSRIIPHAFLHCAVTLESVAVAGEHRPPGRAAVIMLQGVFQPVFNGGEVLTDKNIPKEFFRQIQGVGAAEFQNKLRLGIHFKGHIEGTVNTGDGVVGIGAGLADDIVVAARGHGRGVFDVHEADFLPYEFAGGREHIRTLVHLLIIYSPYYGAERGKSQDFPLQGKNTELIKMHNWNVQNAQKRKRHKWKMEKNERKS